MNSLEPHKIRLHVDDLEFPVRVAGVEVLQAIHLEADGTVDEAVLVGAGVVPERVAVSERVERWVLEDSAAVSTGGEGQEPAAGGEA